MKITINNYELFYESELESYEFQSEELDLCIYQDFIDEHSIEVAQALIKKALSNQDKIIYHYSKYMFEVIGSGVNDKMTVSDEDYNDILISFTDYKSKCRILSIWLNEYGINFEISNNGMLGSGVDMIDYDVNEFN